MVGKVKPVKVKKFGCGQCGERKLQNHGVFGSPFIHWQRRTQSLPNSIYHYTTFGNYIVFAILVLFS